MSELELTLFSSAVDANMAWLGAALIINSVISAGFYLRIIYTMIQPAASEKLAQVKEAPLLMLLPIIALAILIIAFGIWPGPLYSFAQQAAQSLISLGGAI